MERVDSAIPPAWFQLLACLRNIRPASSANVLENALSSLSYSEREAAFNKVDEMIKMYSSPSEKSGQLPAANEIIAGVLTIFGRLDSLLY